MTEATGSSSADDCTTTEDTDQLRDEIRKLSVGVSALTTSIEELSGRFRRRLNRQWWAIGIGSAALVAVCVLGVVGFVVFGSLAHRADSKADNLRTDLDQRGATRQAQINDLYARLDTREAKRGAALCKAIEASPAFHREQSTKPPAGLLTDLHTGFECTPQLGDGQ